MPVGEIAASILEALGKIFSQIFVEIILEILVKGPGYLIIRTFKRSNANEINPDSGIVIVTGITFWIVFSGLVFISLKLI